MSEMKPTTLQAWTRQGQQPLLPAWNELPAIPLYMDQVLLYLTEVLGYFEIDDSPLLTASMVNNYVKKGVLPHPEKKKYSRAHLGALLVICMLKPVLPLSEICTLLTEQPLTEAVYEQFRAEQQSAVHAVCAVVEEEQQRGQNLRDTAVRRALIANAERAAALKILGERLHTETEPQK